MIALKARRVLVTGGAGFIGSHLTEALLNQGLEVRVLDDLSTGREANLSLARAAHGDRLELTRGSILDEKALGAALNGVGVVFHLAALVSVPESVKDPRKSIELNDLGVYAVFEGAAEEGVDRVVFSSSSAVYGDRPVPHHEGLTPAPDTPYAIHKLLGEHYGLFFSRHRNLEVVCLRYFNVYGPRQLPDSPYSGVISIFMENFRRRMPSTIFDDGRQTRDFVEVKDVVRANLLAAGAPAEKVSGLALNIAGGAAVTINDLYDRLAKISGGPARPLYAPPRPGDIRHSAGPITLAAERLGYCPGVTLDEGLAATWRWFAQSRGNSGPAARPPQEGLS